MIKFGSWAVVPIHQWNSLCRAAGESLHKNGKDEYNDRYNETGMLLWRLSGKKTVSTVDLLPVPFEYIKAVDVDDKFLVFVAYNGQGVVLEDDHDLFPSDELIAKLRLLMK